MTSIAIASVNTLKQSYFLGAVILSVSETYYTMCLTIIAMFQIIFGMRSASEIDGPTIIAKYSGHLAQMDLI